MSKPVITVENLSKAYRIGLKEEIPDTLVSAMSGMMKAPFRKFRDLRKLDTFGHSGADEEDIYWALKDVSFEVQEGEVLGVIGRNGAGKSTLLKILSRITEPTSGRAVIRGRVSSLLEVGTGFHPELSGRENVYLNGTILGMMKREIDRKFDEIVDFSGIEKFLDTPIKRYSSGMKVRLAFAVAAHLEPEILIIDEVLAVGDAEFQKKCMGKMQDVASGGRTVLFVSHNMQAVSELCEAGLMLKAGTVAARGDIGKVLDSYSAVLREHCGDTLKTRSDREGSGRIRFTSVDVENARDNSSYPGFGEPLKIRIGFEAKPRGAQDIEVAVGIYTASGSQVAWLGNRLTCGPFSTVAQTGEFECEIGRLSLLPGTYFLNLHCTSEAEVCDWVQNAIQIEVLDGPFYPSGARPPRGWGACAIEHSWSLKCPVVTV